MQDKFEAAIKNAIVRRRADTAGERDTIYRAARVRLPPGRDDYAKALEQVIAKIEASFTRPTTLWQRIRQRAWFTPLAWLAVGAALGWAGNQFLFSKSNAAGPETAKLARFYEESLPLLPVAEAFNRKVLDAVIDRQRSDPKWFETKKQNFIGINEFDDELTKSIPASLPAGTWIVLRADERDVKVLMQGPLCGIVQIARPELLDPVRSRADRFGCQNFGVWTDAAADW